eukprot:TRINITY_DN33880_c0_g1_i1.p1 TRINITY_DN33880_c0_g1~~TRINITY_DN33880_c0_g1_i1.p1  ORF type:complete len:354 (+),score=31.34 TRINITY_DN33880_c0_g1_i1:64-1125(+)
MTASDVSSRLKTSLDDISLSDESPSVTTKPTDETANAVSNLACRDGYEQYSFDVADETWRAHLENEGYVVIRRCSNEHELEHARTLVWDALEQTTPAKRYDVSTWDAWRLDARGFSMHGKVTQGHGAWFLRALPGVRRAFATIWGTNDLICSMDLFLVWKPWWLGPNPKRWLPKTEGLHVDQNPLTKPSFACVQGMLPLYDVTDVTGGLEVVPRSHSPEARDLLVKRLGEDLRCLGDFCTLPKDYYTTDRSKLVTAQAGDLILWDSRTVHGGKVGTGALAADREAIPPHLARLSLPICMTPRSLASAEVLQARVVMFSEGKTTNHWPHEPRVQNHVCLGYEAIDLSETQRELL